MYGQGGTPTTNPARRCYVVYPYSSALRLPEPLRKRGWSPRAVLPADLDAYALGDLKLDHEAWDEVLEGDTGSAWLLAERIHGAEAVLPGVENAVPLAEHTAHLLGLYGNDPASSALRTDKHDMQGALQLADVPHPRTIAAVSRTEALAAAELIGYPVVIKPFWSASSVGVRFCPASEALAAAWDQEIGAVGDLGQVTTGMVVQQFLYGEKWTVSVVAVRAGDDTRYVITDMWRERVNITPTGHVVWAYSLLVPPADEASDVAATLVASYARRALAAADVRWGAANVEIMLTGSGPLLLELAARLSGIYPQDLTELVTGQSQVTCLADALDDPERLAARPAPSGDGRAVAQAWLTAPYDADVDGLVLRRILSLPAVAYASPSLEQIASDGGGRVAVTTSTPTSVGYVNLMGSQEAVAASMALMASIERDDGLYRPAWP
jgi:predicted ATP-grasp superfamily ATP-dependent carboligase